MKVYQRDLPDKCCPLFRLEEALFVPRELIDLYLQPKFTVKEYREGEGIGNSPLSGLTSMVEVTEQAEPGTRIIVSASAGMGKSAFSSHSTRLWCHGQALKNIRLLYLLLPRYIHGHRNPIENIICSDLKLHATSAEAEVRRAIKSNAGNMAFIIDGYDEVMERDQLCSSLNKVISGEVAREAKVVITTRPHCVNRLAKLCQGSYVLVTLQGLTAAASEHYIDRMCAGEINVESRSQSAQVIMSHIPEEARHVPLLLNMAIIIYMWNSKHTTNAGDLPQLRTISDVIGCILAMFCSLQVEKDQGLDNVPVHFTPLDENLQNHHILVNFAKMCFESIKTKKFEFTSEILGRFHFRDSKLLSQLGFLEITHNDEGKVQTARCLHNQMLEYCAAIHVAENSDALQYIISTFSSTEDNIMSEDLGFWKDTLIFSVGINAEVLSTISKSLFSLRVSHEDYRHQCLDLSYEARLIHETESSEARERFCEAIMLAPLKHTKMTAEVII